MQPPDTSQCGIIPELLTTPSGFYPVSPILNPMMPLRIRDQSVPWKAGTVSHNVHCLLGRQSWCEAWLQQAEPLCNTGSLLHRGDILGLEFSFYHPSLQEVFLQTAFTNGGSKGEMNPCHGDSTPGTHWNRAHY